MRPADSPFPCHWWGISLERVGLGDVRPAGGTYGRYEFSALPPVPFELRGDFAWLAAAPVHHEHTIGDQAAARNAQALKALREASDRLGLRLPEAFVTFMATPALHRRIRSCTDCFLDLGPALVRAPVGDGYLLRFLADSQGCLFWYLYLTRDGADHAVVSSEGFYGGWNGPGGEHWQGEEPDAAALEFCAESFEEFMCRFWLENELWFAAWEQTPMPEAGRAYVEQYRRQQ